VLGVENQVSQVPVTEDSLASVIGAIATHGCGGGGGGAPSAAVANAEAVELVVVLVQSALAPEEINAFQLPFIYQSLAAAGASSAVFPQTTRGASVVDESFTTRFARMSGVADAAVNAPEELLLSLPNLMKSGETELVLVEFPAGASASDVDAFAAEISASTSGGRGVVMAYTAQESSSAHSDCQEESEALAALFLHTGARETLSSNSRHLLAAAGESELVDYRYIYATPTLLFGLLFGLFFVSITLTGVSSLGALQCPAEAATVGPASGREY
jgi:hypothetical protein